jgi:hypothetical protein
LSVPITESRTVRQELLNYTTLAPDENVTTAPAVADLPTRIITYAWGESYVDELLTLALPAVLAPGNLPYVASQVECELTLVTEERFFAKIAAAPVIAKVRDLCPIRLVGLDDLVTKPDQYGMALTHALHRAFADLGRDMTDCWLMFLNADFVLADGSLRNLLSHLRRGERIVASPSYCTVKEDVIAELKQRLAGDSTRLTIAPRELAGLILRHRHNTIRGKTLNQDDFHLYQADQFYWSVGEDTLLGHQMPVSIVGMRPQRFVAEPNSFWDHGFMSELCPSAEVKVLGDSDEFLMLELRSGTVAREQIASGRPDPKQLGERMISWVTPYQAKFALEPLTLHAAELPVATESARQQLDDFVVEVLAHAPNFPSHLDHPQWNYHWPDFTRRRHALLSSRLGSLTATDPPPQSMPEIDKLWWRLDGAAKSLERKKRLAAEAKAYQSDLLKKAQMTNWDLTDSAYPRLLIEKGANVDNGPPQGSTANADLLPRDLISAAEAEHRSLQAAYDALLLPRVTSAGPVVQWGIPTQAPSARLGNPIRRLAPFLYNTVFGRWPRVTTRSPLWAATQPLLRAIEAAKARGPKDALIVSDCALLAREFAGSSGKVTRVTKAGFLAGQFKSQIEPREQFDLFVVDLNLDDLSQFHTMVETAKPYVRPDCALIAFCMNKGRPLGAFKLPQVDGDVVFAGSAAVVQAMSNRSAALAKPELLGSPSLRQLLRSPHLLLALPPHVLRLWRANRAEAAATRRGRTPEPDYRTSFTITARAPWVIGEDPSALKARTRAAVGVDYPDADIEAPLAPENLHTSPLNQKRRAS